MRKKKKRKLTKKIFRLSNAFIIVCSILASYSVVVLSNAYADLPYRQSKLDNLVSSTNRIAIAFEQYNEKRFTP